MIDTQIIKKDFPILNREVNGKPLTYLDNAATSQKPLSVIESISNYYMNHNANVHRGIHTLGDEATRLLYEGRRKIAAFIGSDDPDELVFVRNTTEAINLVMRSWGVDHIEKGDVILTTQMEHHSNLVPWQILVKEKGARLEYVEVDEAGELVMEDLDRKLTMKPKLMAVVQVSNFLGAINPIEEIIKKAHGVGAKVLVDAAQSTPHMKIDVSRLDVDFLAFSGHKMLGPMGIGGLFVKKALLSQMKPFLYGGGMIDEVNFEGSSFAHLPDRFDAGTPNVAGAVGLSGAVDYLEKLGMENVIAHERKLVKYALGRLSEVGGVTLFGPKETEKKGGVVAFTMEGIHAHDVAQLLDRQMGVAVRSGHHCVMPLHVKYGVPATTRASFYIYNDEHDVDTLIEGLLLVKKMLG